MHEWRVIRTLREAGATSTDTAKALAELQLTKRDERMISRLTRRGILIEQSGQYHLDEERLWLHNKGGLYVSAAVLMIIALVVVIVFL